MSRHFDLAVVGAGIVGLAHALAAAKKGKRVVVFDRDAQANEASVRNFGFVTVTGQEAGQVWLRAMRSRDIWQDVTAKAGIPVIHQGLLVVARSREAMDVIDAFAQTEMGEACTVMDRDAVLADYPVVRADGVHGGLWSPHERRVEPREAIPAVAAWLEHSYGVTFLRNTSVRAVDVPSIETGSGRFHAEACVVCPGSDFSSLYAERIAAYGLTKCKLHMLRLAAQPDSFRLPGSIMTDPSLVRYRGYSALPEAAVLKAKIEAERPEIPDNGIHLIVVQGADGSLTIGDSHHYAATPDPFVPAEVDDIIVRLANETLNIPEPRVVERWTGVYPSAADRLSLIDAPEDAVRIVMITSGTGMSTAFAIAEEVIADLYG
ncbi:MAG: TIGR03364 family FAD-dependent oxidoreductase [Geminicoccaceae bacterium]